MCALVAVSLSMMGTPLASAPERKPRRHVAADGSVFVYDWESKAWREEEVISEAAAGAEPLALAWKMFDVDFSGGFAIGGRPVLLARAGNDRPAAEQDHADTGRSVWDGAVCLAKLLEAQPKLVEGRAVLEVGAGRGVLGLSAAALRARSVVLTDQKYCLEALRDTVHQNRAAWSNAEFIGEIDVAEFDWFAPERFLAPMQAAQRAGFDLIIGADVVWLEPLAAPLATALAEASRTASKARGGTPPDVLISHQTRTDRADHAFLDAMQAEGFVLEEELVGGGRAQPEDGEGALRWHADFVPDSRFKVWRFRMKALARHGV